MREEGQILPCREVHQSTAAQRRYNLKQKVLTYFRTILYIYIYVDGKELGSRYSYKQNSYRTTEEEILHFWRFIFA